MSFQSQIPGTMGGQMVSMSVLAPRWSALLAHCICAVTVTNCLPSLQQLNCLPGATGAGRSAARRRVGGAAAAAAAGRLVLHTGAAVPRNARHHLAERVQRAGCCSVSHPPDDREQEEGGVSYKPDNAFAGCPWGCVPCDCVFLVNVSQLQKVVSNMQCCVTMCSCTS